MSTMMVSRTRLAGAVRDWRLVSALMGDTARDFERLSAAVLPPRVREEGTAFAGAWAGVAAEARTEAEGFVAALEETLRDFGRVEVDVVESLRGCAASPALAACGLADGLADRLGPLP